MLLTSFAPRAAALGAGLGVDRGTSAVYGEAEIRSSTAFQLSSLLTLLGAGVAGALQARLPRAPGVGVQGWGFGVWG